MPSLVKLVCILLSYRSCPHIVVRSRGKITFQPLSCLFSLSLLLCFDFIACFLMLRRSTSHTRNYSIIKFSSFFFWANSLTKWNLSYFIFIYLKVFYLNHPITLFHILLIQISIVLFPTFICCSQFVLL